MCGGLRRADKQATIKDRIAIWTNDGRKVARWGGNKGDYAFARIESLREGKWKGYTTGHVMVDSISENHMWSEPTEEPVAIAFIYRGNHCALVTREATVHERAQFGHNRMPLVVEEQEDGRWLPVEPHTYEDGWKADTRQMWLELDKALRGEV